LLREESQELPDLGNALDSLLDELENGQERQYNRAEFRRYIMLPGSVSPSI
jgi:hypothetical protein